MWDINNNLESIVSTRGEGSGRGGNGRGVEAAVEVLEGPDGSIVQHIRAIDTVTTPKKLERVQRIPFVCPGMQWRV